MTGKKRKPILYNDFAVRRPIKNRSLTREKDRKHGILLFRIFIICLFIVAPMLFYSWQRMAIIRYGYRIEESRKEAERFKDMNMKLKLEKARLSSLERIEKEASRKLNMSTVEISDVTMVRVDMPPGEERAASNLDER